MYTITNLRDLRLRNGIRLKELARAAGVSNQYISRLELGDTNATPAMEQLMTRSLELIINEREKGIDQLKKDLLEHRGSLLLAEKE